MCTNKFIVGPSVVQAVAGQASCLPRTAGRQDACPTPQRLYETGRLESALAGQAAGAAISGAPAIVDLGVLEYHAAWERQLQWHERVLSGDPAAGVLLLVSHPPVITIGRTPGSATHLLADAAVLARCGVDVVTTDRGGDITFHGPGQLVVYPILPLDRYHLGLHDYMRLLEQVVVDTLAEYGLTGLREPKAAGVWVHSQHTVGLAKICAMGVKLRRWVSLHGLALNITTDLSYFELINPCGLSRPVTSLSAELGATCPAMATVKSALTRHFRRRLNIQ